MKIRIGNDFVFNWAIERGGLPEDLSSVLDAKLTASVFGKKQDIPFTASGNIITIEFTPEICNVIGLYNLLFTYILPDTGLSDEDRKCAVDVDAFQIVAKTAQADDSSEFSVTSDMAIAFKGDKGDKGDSAYQVWLDAGNTGTEDDYFNWLQKPATDIAETVNLQEQARADAENTRKNNEEQRVDAEILRQTNTQTAITNAEEATLNANTAAQNADDARLSIQDDLALKANQTDLAQLESDASVKIANIIVNGDFSNGSAGWTIVSPSVITINNKMIFNGLATNSNGAYTDVPVVGNAKLYLTYKASNEGVPFPNVRLFNYNSFDNGTATNFSQTVSSGVFDSLLGGVRIYFRQSLGATYINATFDNIMLINLTSIFGLGNEPTKEEMDLLLSILGVDYFEGEITIPAQKLMQWQLKMIRQNRSAIIALGGTII